MHREEIIREAAYRALTWCMHCVKNEADWLQFAKDISDGSASSEEQITCAEWRKAEAEAAVREMHTMWKQVMER